jgi:hypothetical protein
VKIENAPESRPQSGLDRADVVYEELVEGGETRFLAVFRSTDPGRVGPVRSVRPMDPALAAPFAGLFAYSGGIPAFVRALRPVAQDLGASTIGEGPPYVRVTGRPVPHNLYVDARGLWAKARPPYDRPPPEVFAYADEAPAGGAPGGRLDLRFPGGDALRWQWRPGRGYARSQAGVPFTQAPGGTQVTCDNVLVQLVDVRASGFVDAAGAPVPESLVVGGGQAWLLRDGRWFTGRWAKPDLRAVTSFTGADGRPLPLRPGRTWVEILPRGGTATVT